MKKFKIKVTDILAQENVYEVEAESKEDAENKFLEKLESGDNLEPLSENIRGARNGEKTSMEVLD